jgi:hypothetical protein
MPTASAVPTAGPTVIPYSPVFFQKMLFFDGEVYHQYASLPIANFTTFTFAAWVSTSTYPAIVVSLGRSAAASAGGECVIDLDKTGRLRFQDYSPNTGYGFSARAVGRVATGSCNLSINQKECVCVFVFFYNLPFIVNKHG